MRYKNCQIVISYILVYIQLCCGKSYISVYSEKEATRRGTTINSLSYSDEYALRRKREAKIEINSDVSHPKFNQGVGTEPIVTHVCILIFFSLVKNYFKQIYIPL